MIFYLLRDIYFINNKINNLYLNVIKIKIVSLSSFLYYDTNTILTQFVMIDYHYNRQSCKKNHV